MNQPERYRSKSETVELLKTYAEAFSGKAREQQKQNPSRANYYRGKAEAYANAAFELEHNMN